jgi:hypothetical protein
VARRKQKPAEKNKEIEKRLKALQTTRAVSHKIAKVHGSFPEINSLIRQTREDTISSCE